MSTHLLHHAFNYIELTVTDMEVAKAFYTRAFGWSFKDYGPSYAAILSVSGDGQEVGGLVLAEQARAAGGPLVLLYSKDLDVTKQTISVAGGRILQPPYEFPGGRRLHFADPSGNELGVWSKD